MFAAHDKSFTLCIKCLSFGKVVQSPASRRVLTANGPAAANGDPAPCSCNKGTACPCLGGPDPAAKNIIFSGAPQVFVGPDRAPFARVVDITHHDAKWPMVGIVLGVWDVIVGGGAVVGNIALFNRICAAHGKQKYDNCGVECARQLINARRAKKDWISQDALLKEAIKNGHCAFTLTDAEMMAHCPQEAKDSVNKVKAAERKVTTTPAGTPDGDAAWNEYETAQQEQRAQSEHCAEELKTKNPTTYQRLLNSRAARPTVTSGRTTTDEQAAVLNDHGVTSRTDESVSWDDLHGAASSGAILNVDAYKTGLSETENEMHAVVLTGVVYDQDGKPAGVMVNDPASGNCGQLIPKDKLDGAVNSLTIPTN